MRARLLLTSIFAAAVIVVGAASADAAPFVTADYTTGYSEVQGPTLQPVHYYWNGRYYPYYYRGHYYRYQHHGHYYNHRYYRHGRWHYY